MVFCIKNHMAICWKRVSALRAVQLRLFGANVTNKIQIAGTVQILFPWFFRSGSYTAIGDSVNIYNLGGVEIGEHVVISQDVYICGGTHDYTKATYPLIRKPIVIKDDVWICAGAFIGIGEGAVVGARAVVTKNIDPWSVVARNPAEFIKKREITDD